MTCSTRYVIPPAVFAQITHFYPNSFKSRDSANASNEVMVVFPFGADEEEIDAAAEGLNELNSASLSRVIDPVGGGSKTDVKTSTDDTFIDMTSVDDAETAENDKGDSNKKAFSRANFVTILNKDKARLLQPQGWLNDNLIDFWIEWYVTYYMFECSKDVHVSHVLFDVLHH